jgi:carboxypeptidase Q
MIRASFRRVRSAAAVLVLPLLGFTLTQIAPAADNAPSPRAAGEVRAVAAALTATELDSALLAEVKDRTEVMKNLEYLSDTIGPRLTGSKQLERANEWTAAKMKEYGLENVKMEPWEIPIGWERGPALLTVVEPDTKVRCPMAAVGWTPGTDGKVTGEVVLLQLRNKGDFEKYKGKLKNAVVITSPPANPNPITDTKYGPLPPAPKKKDEPKKADTKKADSPVSFTAEDEQPKKDEPKKEEPKKTAPGASVSPLIPGRELEEFLKAEGVACRLMDAGIGSKTHGLLMALGQWRAGDRAAQAQLPSAVIPHENYALLYRLAMRPAPAVTKVEVEIQAKFIPGPITVFNTVGEVKGSEKPDEFVVIGAHLDSWDLGTGTMDNGTGSCVVLETARAVAALAKAGHRPKRTIRFCLFTGEEQGLHGSREYVKKHAEEMPKTSLAIVHDTGTGKVTGFATMNQPKMIEILEPELKSLAGMDGWAGLDPGYLFGSDHQSFGAEGVAGFACRQEIDEYRYTHHSQTDTFDHAKGPNLVQGAQVLAVTSVRVANLPELLPRTPVRKKKDPEPKKDDKKDPDSKKDAKKDDKKE